MILVTGATGSNGIEILKRLSQSGTAARAMVRRPDRAGQTLPGVELWRGISTIRRRSVGRSRGSIGRFW